MPADHLERVRRGIESYRRVSEHLEQISDINRELLRRAKGPRRARKKMEMRALEPGKRGLVAGFLQPYRRKIENNHNLFLFKGHFVALFMVRCGSKNYELFVAQRHDWVNEHRTA